MSKIILNGIESVAQVLLLLSEHLDCVGEVGDSGVEFVIAGVEFIKRCSDVRMKIFELGVDEQCKVLFEVFLDLRLQRFKVNGVIVGCALRRRWLLTRWLFLFGGIGPIVTVGCAGTRLRCR